MKNFSDIVKNILEKDSNNNLKKSIPQYSKRQEVKHLSDVTPKMFNYSYNKLKELNQEFFQIGKDDFEKVLNTDYIETTKEFIVFILLYILFNQYKTNFNLKSIKNLANYILNKQKEILGDSDLLVSLSTIKEIIKKFKERGVLRKTFLGLGHKLEMVRPETNFVQVDINFLYSLLKDSDTSNEFYMSMFLFYESYKYSHYNNYFGTSNESIIAHTGGKIKSTSTLNSVIKALESKDIIKIKRVDYAAIRNNHYTFSPDYVDNLLQARNRTGKMGVSDVQAENRTHNNKIPSIINSLNAASASKEFLGNLIGKLESVASANVEKKSVQDVRFQLDTSEREPIYEEMNPSDNRANYGLNHRYGLSFDFRKNLNYMRNLVKKYGQFKNKSPNTILYDIFGMVSKKGAYPFGKNDKGISTFLDRYLLNNKDGKGTIFEKILVYDYKA